MSSYLVFFFYQKNDTNIENTVNIKVRFFRMRFLI